MAGPGTLTVASYNVLYSLAERRAGVDPAQWADPDTVERIRSLEADVILFQETNEAWEGAIVAALAGRYPHCAFHRPRRFLPEGLGVCARHPLEGDTRIESPVGWFPAQRVVVKAPAGAVEIFNVHLRPAVAGPDAWWEAHRETRPARRQEIEAYLGRRAAGMPAIIGGDFNEITEGDLFRALEADGFESALARAKEGGATWRWVGTALAVQLDHLTYDARSFSLSAAKILSGGSSDHVPFVVTLRTAR